MSVPLQPQYDVVRTDTKPLGFHFVLEPGADPLAVEALIFYACLVEEYGGNKELAKKLTEITRQYRTMVCHDCSWSGFPEQMKVKAGKRELCPECDSKNVHKKVVEADAR